jgi:hypothetical protein
MGDIWMLPLLIVMKRIWAESRPEEYDDLVREMNKSASRGSLPAPDTLDELATIIVIAEHPKATDRLKRWVENIKKIYGI